MTILRGHHNTGLGLEVAISHLFILKKWNSDSQIIWQKNINNRVLKVKAMNLSKKRAIGIVKADAQMRRYAVATLKLIPSFIASLYNIVTTANAICTNTISTSGFNLCHILLMSIILCYSCKLCFEKMVVVWKMLRNNGFIWRLGIIFLFQYAWRCPMDVYINTFIKQYKYNSLKETLIYFILTNSYISLGCIVNGLATFHRNV